MKITADTNVLLRALIGDDAVQSPLAIDAMQNAEIIAISLQALCEFVWVVGRQYQMPRAAIAAAIRRLAATEKVVLHHSAVEAGLQVYEAGGDFADGVIAYDGRWLGGETFVSFDKTAVSRIKKLGHDARLLT